MNRSTFVSFRKCRACNGSGKGHTIVRYTPERSVTVNPCNTCEGHGGRTFAVYAEELTAEDWDRMPPAIQKRAMADLVAFRTRNFSARKEAESAA